MKERDVLLVKMSAMKSFKHIRCEHVRQVNVFNESVERTMVDVFARSVDLLHKKRKRKDF